MGSGWPSILSRMSVKLLRRVLALLVVTAYTVAANVAPMAHPATSSFSSTITHEQGRQGEKMPCKGMLPNCVTDIGCIFLVSLPTPDLTLVTTTAWSSVIYDNASEALRGRTIKPALGPPIFLA